jgi:hypothetical protein
VPQIHDCREGCRGRSASASASARSATEALEPDRVASSTTVVQRCSASPSTGRIGWVRIDPWAASATPAVENPRVVAVLDGNRDLSAVGSPALRLSADLPDR